VDDAIAVNSRKTGLFGQTIGAEVGWGLWMVLISSLVLAVDVNCRRQASPEAAKGLAA